MPWINPIFDRTQTDVDYARANRNSPLPLKGARNYTDLNRITGNIHYLSETLWSYGYTVPVTCKREWVLGEVVPHNELDKIRADLNSLKDNYGLMTTTPATPDLPYTHFRKLNDIEKIIFDVATILQRMIDAWFFSGELYSGEVLD